MFTGLFDIQITTTTTTTTFYLYQKKDKIKVIHKI